jgi:hypothetical protein
VDPSPQVAVEDMEGWQTQQSAQPRWLAFAEWLRQQAGGPSEEAVSEASTSDAEDASLPAEPIPSSSSAASTSTQAGSSSKLAAMARPAAGSSGSSSTAGAAPVSPSHLARHATLAPRLPDCRAEMRLTSDTSSRARQEMTVMLTGPGMPLNEAPMLTCKQVCEGLALRPPVHVKHATEGMACAVSIVCRVKDAMLLLFVYIHMSSAQAVVLTSPLLHPPLSPACRPAPSWQPFASRC